MSKSLFTLLLNLQNSKVKQIVDNKISEFKSFSNAKNSELFKELCFCLMTANFVAEKSLAIQKKIGAGFLTLAESVLAEKLKQMGHRFPNTRAKYIIEAREHINNLRKIIKGKDELEIREWFVQNVKGLGYKEASHFLRNIGFENFAIVDFHIVDLLVRNGFMENPRTKSFTRNKYLEIEKILERIAKKSNLTLAELDLYLWYSETGKIVK